MVISLVYHNFFWMNIQDYQLIRGRIDPAYDYRGRRTHISRRCMYIIYIYTYKYVVYNYPIICTMRGLEHAEGLDIWAVAHISHHLNRSVGALVFFCRQCFSAEFDLPYPESAKGTQDKSPSSTFHTVGRVWGMRSMEGFISRMIQAFGANPPQCPYWDRTVSRILGGWQWDIMGYRAHWTPLKYDAVQHLPAQMDAPAVRWGGRMVAFIVQIWPSARDLFLGFVFTVPVLTALTYLLAWTCKPQLVNWSLQWTEHFVPVVACPEFGSHDWYEVVICAKCLIGLVDLILRYSWVVHQYVYTYECVVYNYPIICTMRGLEHAEGLDIWAVAHISHHLNRSVGALVFFCRQCFSAEFDLPYPESARDTGQKSI